MPLLKAVQIGAGRLQHPATDRFNQAGFFGQGNEFIRGNHATFGMMPARQRLESCPSAGLQIHNGLVMHVQFVVLQGLVQFAL